MEPKSELLVFNKKEIAVIIILLVLVAMFSFTLGLRLGKTLGSTKAEPAEQAPLSGHGEHKETAPTATGEHEAAPVAEKAGDPHGAASHAEPHAAKDEHAVADAGSAEHKGDEKENEEDSAQTAEDHADAEFAKEASNTKAGLPKPVPMTLPKEKKSVLRPAEGSAGFTLQVGSHRTVAEAAEQVSALKHSGYEAFYVEAKVPGKGTWYRVGIGFYPTKDQAERAGEKLRASKRSVPSFIVQKINE